MYSGNVVVGFVDLDMGVAVNGAFGFLEAGEKTGRQREQGRLFLGKQGGDLFASGAVNAHVGDGLFPMGQELVLLGQAGEAAAFEGVGFQVTDIALAFSFVFGVPGPTRHQGDAVMATKAYELWIQIRIIPIGPADRGPEVVEVQGFGDTAEVTKGVFQTADERLSGLIPNCLAVGLARKAQHNAKDPRLASPTTRLDHRCSATKIDLSFLRRLNLDPADRRGRSLFESANESLDGLIGALEADFDNQVLINALGGQTKVDFGFDPLGVCLTFAGTAARLGKHPLNHRRDL